MQPSSHQPPARDSRRIRLGSLRPEKYSVEHPPRHVVPATNEGAAGKASRRSKVRRRIRCLRRLTPWEWAGIAASLIASAFLTRAVVSAQSDFRQVRRHVSEKRLQLAALDRQKTEEQNRLAHLRSEKGREQLLVERGYLKPGDRILLFPNDGSR